MYIERSTGKRIDKMKRMNPTRPAPACPCGLTHDDEDPARKFYVSVIEDSGDDFRAAYLSGPYDDHGAALADVAAVRAIAEELYPRAVFYSFGTCRTAIGYDKPGVLNVRLQAVKAAAKSAQKTAAKVALNAPRAHRQSVQKKS